MITSFTIQQNKISYKPSKLHQNSKKSGKKKKKNSQGLFNSAGNLSNWEYPEEREREEEINIGIYLRATLGLDGQSSQRDIQIIY